MNLAEYLMKNPQLTVADYEVTEVSAFPIIEPFVGFEGGCTYSLRCSATVYAGCKPKREKQPSTLRPERVIFNPPATIVIWNDGTKTVVKAQDARYDRMTGVALCYMKKSLGNTSRALNDALKAAGIWEDHNGT